MMLLVITNMPDVTSATVLANAIIEQRAAACVNILSACTSVYRWQEKVETSTEIPVLIKTTQAAYAQIETLIRATHPYELPEIIAVPVSEVSPEYLSWVTAETQSYKE